MVVMLAAIQSILFENVLSRKLYDNHTLTEHHFLSLPCNTQQFWLDAII